MDTWDSRNAQLPGAFVTNSVGMRRTVRLAA